MGNDERQEEEGLFKMKDLITKYLMTVACYNDDLKQNGRKQRKEMTDKGGLQAQGGESVRQTASACREKRGTIPLLPSFPPSGRPCRIVHPSLSLSIEHLWSVVKKKIYIHMKLLKHRIETHKLPKFCRLTPGNLNRNKCLIS